MQFSASFLSIVLIAVAGRVTALPADGTAPMLEGIPAGSPDGLYFGSLNEDGTTLWEYQGDIATTTFAPTSEGSNATVGQSQIVKRDFVACNNVGVNANDVAAAQNKLISLCGNGFAFNGRSIAQTSGSGVAYGCNYGNGQTCHAGDLNNFFSQVNGRCGFESGGTAGAGWYAAEDWKAAYGRTSVGTGFC